MGERHEPKREPFINPGPGQYENHDKHKTILSNAASFSFTKDERSSSLENIKTLPQNGPGRYDPYAKGSMDQVLGKMSKEERLFGNNEKDKKPGPGAYTPQKPM